MREKDLSQGKPRESRLDCRIRLMEVFEDTLSMIAEEKALSEAAGTAEEADILLCQLIDEVGLVNIDKTAINNFLKRLYTDRILHDL